MFHIRKNDMVMIITGKDKGKTGKVLKIFPRQRRAIVEGLNLIKKHARRTREDQQGGIIHRESPLDVSNLMFYCPRCSRATRTGITILKDGSKNRFCKKCNELIG